VLEKINNSQFIIRFKRNKRGLIALYILSFLFITSLFAEFIANDKPLILWLDSKIYFPIFQEISEVEIGGELETSADFRDPYVVRLIEKKGWMLMPLIEFSYDTINLVSDFPAPSPPNSTNLLGSDDQGRDVLARIIYGIRISLTFAILLSFFSAIIAILLGAIQGYFVGMVDIILQRFSEIWSSLPMMFLLIIFSAIIAPSFFTLLVIMTIFSWMSLASTVRAEFLRLRNFEFVLAQV
jgi:microcin C transport system permease protein